MKTIKIYEAERSLLKRKFPALNCLWETRELIEQLISPLLARDEATFMYQKLTEGLRAKAKLHLNSLLHLIEVDKRQNLFRVVIAVRVFRDCFADELTDMGDNGGGGGPKNRITSRFGKF